MNIILSILVFLSIFISNAFCQKIDTTFYETGEIKQIRSFNVRGKEEGIRFSFYKSGKKALEVNFSNGIRHGVIKSWYENGQITRLEPCKYDTSYGWHVYWDSLGNPQDSVLYVNDKKIERIDFFKGTHKRKLHQYYHWIDGKKLIAMEDIYSESGKIISQIRNGNGYNHQFYSGKYYGVLLYKKGKDVGLVEPDKKDPRHSRQPIPKSKLYPWDIEKYGRVK